MLRGITLHKAPFCDMILMLYFECEQMFRKAFARIENS